MQPSVLGFVDHAHAAASEFLDDAVVRNSLANHLIWTSPVWNEHVRSRPGASQRALRSPSRIPLRRLYIKDDRPNHIHKPRRFPFARRTGTFVPLPTPRCGRRMPARKSPEGRRGQPAWQNPSTTSTHFTRGRLISAAFLFSQNHPGRWNSTNPTPRLRTQDEHPKRGFLVRLPPQNHSWKDGSAPRLSPSQLHKIRGVRLMKNPGLRLATFGASVDSPARIQYD
jgi:hypothetical protein